MKLTSKAMPASEGFKANCAAHLDAQAQHSYPREVAFLEELPMTVTGKVIRKELKRIAKEEAGL
ncbi:hypothetical protein M3P21_10680 [Ruegeria sp. 2012CJ41-6]|uniref:Long-chain-fatty-acid--CoA ligase n=1 Tax=Ruegeria spongiae TaxID=2942209 RepID=A0ABT0Q2A3_9RHOB|nr:hypothetical protein [Ruegeria spongiae]MCL6283996.1 hypothetical protein [Ruegeria spongiae]